MTKTCRKPILVILLTLCLTALCGVMLACNDDKPTDATIAYSVTVKTAEGDPAAGVDVKVKKGSASFGTKATGADGKAEFTLAKDNYTVELTKLPDGYELPEGALALTAESPELTVTLEKAFAYTIKLVQADGETPFYAAGVRVGIYLSSGTCLNPTTLPESGIVSIAAAKNDYHVQIINLPAGYSYDGGAYGRTDNIYYTGGDLSADDTEITIRVYPVVTADLTGTAMTPAEKEAFDAELQESGGSFDMDEDHVAHMFTTAALKSTDVAYYMFTPAISGNYKLYCKTNSVYDVGETFASALPANPMMGANYGVEITARKGKTYYLAVAGVSEEQAAPVKFAIVDPTSSYIEYNGISGEIDVEIGKAGDNAVIEFKPTAAGAYKATTQGDALTGVSVTTMSGLISDPYDGEYAKGSNASIKVTPDVLGSTTVFYMIAVQASTYPVTVTVKIEQLNTVANTTSIVAVGETLTQYADAPADKELTYVPMSEDTVLVYNSTDKFYHLGTADGPVVLVNLTEELPSNRFANGLMLAYLDMDSQMAPEYVLDVTSAEDKASLTKGNTYKDYRRFIRGFDDYEYTAMGYPQLPDTLAVENCYVNYVNDDGVYPLTQELKAFLELFCEINMEKFMWQIPMDAEYGCEWMFALCSTASRPKPTKSSASTSPKTAIRFRSPKTAPRFTANSTATPNL